ncbi:gag/pol protein [Cucumis melo var. makuwa]|uniref:Gag/pol protein n=1 Tax=Cucumis melo var. makuwa TaxID=1194695 RepID=A0A5A7SSX5_CUCMM|nr:gag/pol protein [Cucumis melo var. makuwa]TYK19043.1 gag/pol protein [Cucumis melo var. makuwa]
MIIVIADLCFVLMEECHFPTQNASQRDPYDHWTKANDKAYLYILASMSDILNKKYEIMVTACQIMDSLREMFGQSFIQIKQNAIKYVYYARMKEDQSVREHVLNMIVNFNVVEMNGAVFDEKSQGKGHTTAAEGKGKAKVAIKGKCFHCNMNGHWKRNCLKYLAKKKEKEGKYDLLILDTCFVENDQNVWILDSGATNHVCSSLQETSSFSNLRRVK